MGKRAAVCKQGCGLPVQWVKDGRRWKCLNADGSDHWDLCSKTRTAVALRDGKPFEEQRADGASGAGVVHQGKKKYMAMSAPTERKELPTCAGCVPPWEVCPNSCPAEFAHG